VALPVEEAQAPAAKVEEEAAPKAETKPEVAEAAPAEPVAATKDIKKEELPAVILPEEEASTVTANGAIIAPAMKESTKEEVNKKD